ncbi:MAG: hypothetical protein ABR878_18600 [Roseiarcus sp.]|jgi:hypothetical protein
MSFRQIVQHLQGALIEVQYAAADISYRLSSSPAAARSAEDEAMLTALFAARRLLQDVLAVSLLGSLRERTSTAVRSDADAA